MTRATLLVSLFQVSKELIVLLAASIFIFYNRNVFDYPFRLKSTDWFMLAFIGLAVLFLLLPIGQASFINKALYFKSIFIPSLVYFLGRNTNFADFELRRLFQIIFIIAIGAFLINMVEHYLLNAHLQQFTGYALFNEAINNIDPQGNFNLTWTYGFCDRIDLVFDYGENASMEIFTSNVVLYRKPCLCFITSFLCGIFSNDLFCRSGFQAI